MNKHNNKSGDGRKTRLEPWEIFQQIKESQIKTAQLAIHPEAHGMRKQEWEGMLTIRFESGTWSKEGGESARENFIRLLMDNLRQKWKLSGDDVLWVYSTEFGESGVAHCHLLFNFYQLKKKGLETPNVFDLEPEAIESADFICAYPDFRGLSVNVNWQPKFDNFGLVGYVAKKEPGREFKLFTWSTEGNQWIDDVLEAAANCEKEGQQ